MTAALGFPTLRLVRVSIGGLELADLGLEPGRGQHRVQIGRGGVGSERDDPIEERALDGVEVGGQCDHRWPPSSSGANTACAAHELSASSSRRVAAVRRRRATAATSTSATATIGIASNKLLAKLASDYQKPDGLTLVRESAKRAGLSAV